MTDNSFTSQRIAWRKGSQAKKQPQRVRPQVEGLEDRVVPSYFPTTTNGIHIFEDQLPGGLSSAMMQFVATHTDGTQKQLLSQTNQFRAINPNYHRPALPARHRQQRVRLHHQQPVVERLELRQPAGELVRPPDLFRRAAIGGRPGQRPGGQQHRLGPGRHRQPRLATVHAEPGLPEHGGHRLQRLVRRQLHLRHRRGRIRQHHSDALPGHQRRQPRVLARRRHLDHAAGQLGPDRRKRFRPAQRDLRHQLQVHPQPRRAGPPPGSQTGTTTPTASPSSTAPSWKASASTPTPTTGRCR